MPRHLLAWDAPNIDMTLANIIDDKPTSKERPDPDVLRRWLVGPAGALGRGQGKGARQGMVELDETIV